MLSIGGITYMNAWNQALAAKPHPARTQRGGSGHAARRRHRDRLRGEHASPNLAGLQVFIDAYRSMHPVRRDRQQSAARLTIDLAAGDRWLIGITAKATRDWLDPTCRCWTTPTRWCPRGSRRPPTRRPTGRSTSTASRSTRRRSCRWRRPSSPAACGSSAASRIAGVHELRQSLQKSTGTFVQTVAPHPQGPGITSGHAGLHVLGGRVSGVARRVHDAAQRLPGRRRRGRDRLRGADSDAAVAAAIAGSPVSRAWPDRGRQSGWSPRGC